jgi:hypothetical protein
MTTGLSLAVRRRVVHGWAFREHTVAQKFAILRYLETGDVLEDFPYKAVHQIAEEGKLGR